MSTPNPQSSPSDARLAAIVQAAEDAILSKSLDGVIRAGTRRPSACSATAPTRSSATMCGA